MMFTNIPGLKTAFVLMIGFVAGSILTNLLKYDTDNFVFGLQKAVMMGQVTRRGMANQEHSNQLNRTTNTVNMNQADTFEDNINHPHISKMTDDVRFPYKKYTEFAMEWKGIVDEYEWMYSNLKREIGTSKTPFVIGNENFSLTSTVKSRVYVYGKRKIFKKGDTVHIVVEAYDKYGNARKKGGDFLQAIMSNKKLVKSTAGRVLDYGNGTYSVYFYAAWAGQASIDVIKPFSREFILYMNNVLRHKELRIPRDGDFGDGVNTYKGVCYLIHDRRWENMCTYENKNSLGQTVLVCDKPKDPLQCKDIVNVTAYTTYLHRVASEDVAGADYIFKDKEDNQFAATPLTINIQDATPEKLNLPLCGPDMAIPLFDGYWTDDMTYVSMVCRSQQWTRPQLDRCLSRNLVFRLSGDSTLGQLQWALGKRKYSLSVWTDLSQMLPNALRIGPQSHYVWNYTFESEFMDSIDAELCKNNQVIVVMNFMFHYAMFSTRSYIDRLMVTKFAVERLFKRCPTAKLFFKSAHPRDNIGQLQSLHSSNFIFYDFDRMIRRIFGGMGVYFLGVWDMSLSHFSELNVHMDMRVIVQQAHLLLSYVCPDLVE